MFSYIAGVETAHQATVRQVWDHCAGFLQCDWSGHRNHTCMQILPPLQCQMDNGHDNSNHTKHTDTKVLQSQQYLCMSRPAEYCKYCNAAGWIGAEMLST